MANGIDPRLYAGVKWYFAFDGGSASSFADMIKVAVTSARRNTTLEPHCLYDGDDHPLLKWLEGRGVAIHRTQVPFLDRIRSPEVIGREGNSSYNPESARGYYLPLQIPEVEQTDEFVLFTDCDVVFQRDPDLRRVRSSILAAVPEIQSISDPRPDRFGKGFNSGVMLLNVAGFRSLMPRLQEALERNGYYRFPEAGAIYDQGLLNTVLGDDWDRLPVEYNWRTFFGRHAGALMVHWHGPKPRHILEQEAEGQVSANAGGSIVSLAHQGAEGYRHHYAEFGRYFDMAERPAHLEFCAQPQHFTADPGKAFWITVDRETFDLSSIRPIARVTGDVGATEHYAHKLPSGRVVDLTIHTIKSASEEQATGYYTARVVSAREAHALPLLWRRLGATILPPPSQ